MTQATALQEQAVVAQTAAAEAEYIRTQVVTALREERQRHEQQKQIDKQELELLVSDLARCLF